MTNIPTSAEIAIIEHIVNKVSNSNLKLCLFSNIMDFEENYTSEDFVELSGGGYKAIELIGELWSISSEPVMATYTQQSFLFNGSCDKKVYGYYVIRGNGDLMWAEKFKESLNIQNEGDEIKISLNYVQKVKNIQ